MYPVLFRIGSFEVTSFGAMVAMAALVGLWLFHRELGRSRVPTEAADAGIVGVLGGLVGAKLLWTIEHAGEAPWSDLLFARGGLSWYGGLIGGVGAGLIYIVIRGWPLVPTLAAATPSLAFGHMLGRIGCLLVGDDYGRPTDLPWGIAFPDGLPPTTVPVHPTQIYEALGLAVLGSLLIHWRRRGVPERIVLGRYLLGAGGLRFAVEFLRVNERVALGLSVAHFASIAIAAVGALLAWTPPEARKSGGPADRRI
jgi:phosphatidylglycerol:prolipoprotein diacylglycerol transferase